MFLCLPDLAPLAVQCLVPGVLSSREGSWRDDMLSRFSDDHDALLQPQVNEASMKVKTRIQAGFNPWTNHCCSAWTGQAGR